MNHRLRNLILAAIWLLSFQDVVWAQHHGRSAGGGSRRTGSSGVSSRRDGRDGSHGNRPGVIATAPDGGVIRPGIGVGGPTGFVFAQPYYVFRQRSRVRPGLFLGFAVGYPSFPFFIDQYAYPYPYYYSAPLYTSSGPSSGYTNVVPNAPLSEPNTTAPTVLTEAIGGVSFEITPEKSAVFVDGVYVGMASDFSPTRPPLSLKAGVHRVELRAERYQTIVFDVDVIAGTVVPYQGVLQSQP